MKNTGIIVLLFMVALVAFGCNSVEVVKSNCASVKVTAPDREDSADKLREIITEGFEASEIKIRDNAENPMVLSCNVTEDSERISVPGPDLFKVVLEVSWSLASKKDRKKSSPEQMKFEIVEKAVSEQKAHEKALKSAADRIIELASADIRKWISPGSTEQEIDESVPWLQEEQGEQDEPEQPEKKEETGEPFPF